MNSRRDHRGSRVTTFDGIEEGGIRALSSYSHEIDEINNETVVDGLEDRDVMLERLTGDAHEEDDELDARGTLSVAVEQFKMVLATRSGRRTCTIIATFIVIFIVVYYYLTR